MRHIEIVFLPVSGVQLVVGSGIDGLLLRIGLFYHLIVSDVVQVKAEALRAGQGHAVVEAYITVNAGDCNAQYIFVYVYNVLQIFLYLMFCQVKSAAVPNVDGL